MYIYVCIDIYIYVPWCVCICIHTHRTCIHTHRICIHTHMYTHPQESMPLQLSIMQEVLAPWCKEAFLRQQHTAFSSRCHLEVSHTLRSMGETHQYIFTWVIHIRFLWVRHIYVYIYISQSHFALHGWVTCICIFIWVSHTLWVRHI